MMESINSEALKSYSKYNLLEGATHIQPLTRLNKLLNGVEIHVKRDDIMGMGLAGNKLRKLEYLIGDALQQHADLILTTGGLQSNHARLTAVAASYAGLACELVLTNSVPISDTDYTENGNILLEQILGAKIDYLPKGADAQAYLAERMKTLQQEGKKPYLAPMGGSSPVGCLGYASCFYEILAQTAHSGVHFNEIIVPNGSGGTQAGLVAGLAASGRKDIKIKSYTVLAQLAAAQSATYEKAVATLKLLDPELIISEDDIVIDPGFLGTAYGIPTDEMISAVKLLARTEGIFLDPVYSGKAFAGLLADIHAGKYKQGDQILFILTGGLPGLFAYKNTFGNQ